MLRDFEQRFAEVLGTQLPAPFAGQVTVAPPGPGNAVQVVVSAGKMEVMDPDFGSFRSESAPGVTNPLRVLRLRGEVGITVRPAQNQGRSQQVEGIDALLYLLDTPEFRSANALASQQDRGFVLSSMKIMNADLSIRDQNTDPSPDITLEVEGWFWPIGQTGVAGSEIQQAQVRQFVLPVLMATDNTPIVPGGSAVPLSFQLGAAGTMQIQANSVSSIPFGDIAVRLRSAAGGPGLGTLSGGNNGPDNSQLVPLVDGAATVDYTPPGSAANENVIVSTVIMDGNNALRLGIELARYNLRVGS